MCDGCERKVKEVGNERTFLASRLSICKGLGWHLANLESQTFDRDIHIFSRSVFKVSAKVSKGVWPVESRKTNKRHVFEDLRKGVKVAFS